MGWPGSALDNAVIEAWQSTLAFEPRPVENFAAEAAARAKVAAWIDHYSRRQRHSALGMMFPASYETALAPGRRPERCGRGRPPLDPASVIVGLEVDGLEAGAGVPVVPAAVAGTAHRT